ncbi:sulfite exporter TauE/SafE family protein [Tabrizicola fusiformis]|uniref:sulfite exporter TauE/SafE family protein n=1 Tax=Tabrizicola sp. SY72 TaxID=2741673 RepID=UPI001571E256|nr:sulfite exporter TauE/SafE family protein [Tabrizicola sp. SY72]NTT86762.1 sulfite exporter TauE/SafE family protein [Tabrizicola sp. SY72]
MDWTLPELSPLALTAALAVTGFAGFVKGAVGFAMPMIMISAFSGFLTPHQALAGLILPTLVTNLTQALRDGLPVAVATARHFHRFVIATLVLLLVSAQFVELIPQTLFLVLLGLPITVFAALQLAGRKLALRLEHRHRAEWVLGAIGGLYGGVSGVWGPPLLVYLLSVGTDKAETVRVQGVIFLLGAITLLGAHLGTGVLDGPNLIFSALLVLPALAGQTLGQALQDRLDQVRFRRWTQVLLVLTGLNLVRQALLA